MVGATGALAVKAITFSITHRQRCTGCGYTSKTERFEDSKEKKGNVDKAR